MCRQRMLVCSLLSSITDTRAAFKSKNQEADATEAEIDDSNAEASPL